jgi:hypothetical protein
MKNVSDTMNIHHSSIGIAGHKTDIILLLHRRNEASILMTRISMTNEAIFLLFYVNGKRLRQVKLHLIYFLAINIL